MRVIVAMAAHGTGQTGWGSNCGAVWLRRNFAPCHDSRPDMEDGKWKRRWRIVFSGAEMGRCGRLDRAAENIRCLGGDVTQGVVLRLTLPWAIIGSSRTGFQQILPRAQSANCRLDAAVISNEVL